MQGRNWIVAAIAVAIGLIAVLIANAWFSGVEQSRDTAVVEQKLERIVVASQPMEFGTRLNPQNVRLQAWPGGSVPEGAFRSVADALKNNRVALRPMVPGEPVLASKVSGADGRATLAAILPDGMRAKTIAIGAVSGVAGFVLPGTMVDVLLTRKIAGEGATPEDIRSDVVLENVQVLAIDQLADDKSDKPKPGKTATLAVTLYDAQRLEVAERVGSLSLVLRKVEDAAGPVDGNAVRSASTVTNRQLGGPRFVIPARGQGRASAPAFQGPPVPMAAGPATAAPISGPTMIVVRGTEPMTYPVGNLGGR